MIGPDTPSRTNSHKKAPNIGLSVTENHNAPPADRENPPSADPTAASDQPPGRRRMKRSTRRAFAIIAVLAVLVAVGFGGVYLLYTRNFVTTDNAQVDGNKIDITAPATGTLIDWRGQQGAQLSRNEYIGRVRVGTSGAQPQVAIKSPGIGTLAVNNVVPGMWVTAGSQLATAYDLNRIYVTARVDETDVAGIRLGAPVDISADAYSGAPITGMVTDVQAGTAGQFALFPQNNSTGNFQKVTQVVPVRIAFTNTAGAFLVPGMNVTVHIHKQA